MLPLALFVFKSLQSTMGSLLQAEVMTADVMTADAAVEHGHADFVSAEEMTSLLQLRLNLNATAEGAVEHGQSHGKYRIHGKAATPTPNVVIFGIGDSGTRGVKLMMQHLGISMCSQSGPNTGDNALTKPAQEYVPSLLEAANGRISKEGYMSSTVFNKAVLAESAGAQNTLDCIIEDMGLTNASLPIGFKWGFKNPQHTYLMPVMDVAFHSKHKMVMVARDFRDLCTSDNLGQYLTYGEIVLGEIVDRSLAQCMRFLASVWASVLHEYGDNENFLVVRVEDLVMPDPTASNTSQLILKRVMEHAADISPSTEQIQEELKEPHAHRDSYMGHHYGMTLAERTTLEIKTASYAGEVHEVMKALGYRTHHYGLIDPSHPRVLSPSAFL